MTEEKIKMALDYIENETGKMVKTLIVDNRHIIVYNNL